MIQNVSIDRYKIEQNVHEFTNDWTSLQCWNHYMEGNIQISTNLSSIEFSKSWNDFENFGKQNIFHDETNGHVPVLNDIL